MMINYANLQDFDVTLLYFLNTYVGLYPKLDSVVGFLAGFNPIKMGPMVLVLWGFWFKQDNQILQRRTAVIRACLGCVSAMIIARGCTLLTNFRFRPLHNSELILTLRDGMSQTVLDGWSSSPVIMLHLVLHLQPAFFSFIVDGVFLLFYLP